MTRHQCHREPSSFMFIIRLSITNTKDRLCGSQMRGRWSNERCSSISSISMSQMISSFPFHYELATSCLAMEENISAYCRIHWFHERDSQFGSITPESPVLLTNGNPSIRKPQQSFKAPYCVKFFCFREESHGSLQAHGCH